MLFVKGFLLLKLRSGGSAEKREAAFVQHMEVPALSDMVDMSLDCTCMRCSIFDKRSHRVCRRELECGFRSSGQWEGVEILLSSMDFVHLVRCNLAFYPSVENCNGCTIDSIRMSSTLRVKMRLIL